MSPKLYLNFYNDAEQIRDHMVDFLVENGTVSKTRFGIELGTICKTPNRGRTKLVVDTYPNIFTTNGQTVTLIAVPPKKCCSPEEAREVSEAQQWNTSPKMLALEEQQSQYVAPTDPQQLYPSSSVHDQPHSTPITSHQMSSYPFTIPSITSQLSTPLQDSGMVTGIDKAYSGQRKTLPPFVDFYPYGVGSYSPAPSPCMDRPKLYPTLFHYQNYQNQGYNENKSQDRQKLSLFQSDGHQFHSEFDVINLLKNKGGTLEVSDLVLSMGISLSDSQAQHKLYDLLYASPYIGIEGEKIYLVEAAAVHQQQLTVEPSMPGLAGLQDQQSSCNTSSYTQIEDDGSSTPINPIQINSINVENINVQTINLHLHLQHPDNLQIQELLKLQSLMKDMFTTATKQSV
eukprot:TRINITY_DN2169_c0_g1_i1.p1 TRINITY_DN2169_c0_g1~~TRINITY_DN2169_c0_g1_i1.p1  ORF type:complete len:400 (-),score=43.49 TRINITY_DN2169_c0_g1_i1:1318-2517(-)